MAAYDALSEAETVDRMMEVLSLAAGSPLKPAMMRGTPDAPSGEFGPWLKVPRRVLAVVEALEDGDE